MYACLFTQKRRVAAFIKISLACSLFVFSANTYAVPKVFTVVVNEDVSIERVYEEMEISFTITASDSGDEFFTNGTIKGIAGLDPISGRMIVEVQSLNKSGMAMQAVGYVEDKDKVKGIDACTLWQTRMFEETKLCYSAQVKKGTSLTIVLDTEDQAKMPVASGQ